MNTLNPLHIERSNFRPQYATATAPTIARESTFLATYERMTDDAMLRLVE